MCSNWDQVGKIKGRKHQTNVLTPTVIDIKESCAVLGFPLGKVVEFERHLIMFLWGSFGSYPSILSLSSSLYSLFLWQITVSKFDSLLPYNLKDKGTVSILLATIGDHSFPSRDLPCGSFKPLFSLPLPILAVPQDLRRRKRSAAMQTSKSRPS